MNRAGAQEVFLPGVQPAELWQESGRWDFYGKELLRFKDRHDRDYCLGPTHEEVITDLVRHEIKTYRQLPRQPLPDPDQVPRRDPAPLRRDARPRVQHEGRLQLRRRRGGRRPELPRRCSRPTTGSSSACGLEFRAVEADSGHHRRQLLPRVHGPGRHGRGRHRLLRRPATTPPTWKRRKSPNPEDADRAGASSCPLEEVHTPDVRTIEEVCAFLKVDAAGRGQDPDLQCRWRGRGRPGPGRRGDQRNQGEELPRLRRTGAGRGRDDSGRDGLPRGFAGAVGIKPTIVADYSLMGMRNIVMGANRADYHVKNVNLGRDFTVKRLRRSPGHRGGDVCPRCGKP